MSREIEVAIKRHDWQGARRLVRAALRQTPDSHWLLTRLALTYYEAFDYKRALTISLQAYQFAPRCPLVLWDLVGSYDMLRRHKDAISLYRKLIRRGIESVAYDECGEGLAWARSLIADCWYRLAHCEREIGRRSRAANCYKQHIAMRGPGCHSIYPLRSVRRELRELTA